MLGDRPRGRGPWHGRGEVVEGADAPRRGSALCAGWACAEGARVQQGRVQQGRVEPGRVQQVQQGRVQHRGEGVRRKGGAERACLQEGGVQSGAAGACTQQVARCRGGLACGALLIGCMRPIMVISSGAASASREVRESMMTIVFGLRRGGAAQQRARFGASAGLKTRPDGSPGPCVQGEGKGAVGRQPCATGGCLLLVCAVAAETRATRGEWGVPGWAWAGGAGVWGGGQAVRAWEVRGATPRGGRTRLTSVSAPRSALPYMGRLLVAAATAV